MEIIIIEMPFIDIFSAPINKAFCTSMPVYFSTSFTILRPIFHNRIYVEDIPVFEGDLVKPKDCSAWSLPFSMLFSCVFGLTYFYS